MATSSEPIKLIEDVRDISAITYGFKGALCRARFRSVYTH
jgi:hypothetical protein